MRTREGDVLPATTAKKKVNLLVNISIHDIYLTSRIIQIIYFNETTIKNPNNILVFQTSFYILHCDAKDPELKYLGLRIRQNLRIQ